MSLPELLRELSSALQSGGGRIRVQNDTGYGHGPMETLYVIHGGRPSRLGILSPAKFSDFDNSFTLLHLEAALREECEARGWTWTVEYVEPRNYWSHIDRPGYRHGFGSHGAATPAEALALALLVALKAEKGGG